MTLVFAEIPVHNLPKPNTTPLLQNTPQHSFHPSTTYIYNFTSKRKIYRKEEADKESLLGLDYPVHLWLEKEIKSVANICRKDVIEFLTLAAEMQIKSEIQEFALEDANEALVELKTRRIRGQRF